MGFYFRGKDRAGAETIAEKQACVGYEDVELKGNKLRFKKEGMGIELGAVAKGYIADKVKEYLVSEGVKSAVIDLGGNVLCVGEKPDGKPFKIGIQKPFADRSESSVSRRNCRYVCCFLRHI